MERRKVFASAARSTVNHAEINKSLMSSLAAFFINSCEPFHNEKKMFPAPVLPKIRQKFAISQCSRQESIFRSKNNMFPPPPFWKWYFSSSCDKRFFLLPSWPFCLNSPLFYIYFTLLLPLFSFSFPFLPFSFKFSLISSPFHIFSHKWHRLIISSPWGGGGVGVIFQYIDPGSRLSL